MNSLKNELREMLLIIEKAEDYIHDEVFLNSNLSNAVSLLKKVREELKNIIKEV